MNKEILPTILSTEDVLKIQDEVLVLFTRISTDIIVDKVNSFIEKNRDSSDAECREAALKLENAYKDVNELNAYLKSDEVKNLANTLAALQYSDVSASTDLNQLKTWRSLIIDLLSDDAEFMKEYFNEEISGEGIKRTAYTAKLDKENLETIMADMEKAAHGNQYALSLISRVEKNSSLFKNGSYNINKPTVLRKAIYKKDKLRNILRGLDFLIPRLEGGQSPATWRRL